MIKINPTGDKPLYEQIIDSIKSNYAKGVLKPGDEIPSVRKMAMQLSVTPNTVSKAYQELERDKVIVTIRGKGTYISNEGTIKVNDERIESIEKALAVQIVELTCMGFDKSEIVAMVEKIYGNIKEGK